VNTRYHGLLTKLTGSNQSRSNKSDDIVYWHISLSADLLMYFPIIAADRLTYSTLYTVKLLIEDPGFY